MTHVWRAIFLLSETEMNSLQLLNLSMVKVSEIKFTIYPILSTMELVSSNIDIARLHACILKFLIIFIRKAREQDFYNLLNYLNYSINLNHLITRLLYNYAITLRLRCRI